MRRKKVLSRIKAEIDELENIHGVLVNLTTFGLFVFFLKMLIKILGKPVEAIMNKGESTNTTYVYEYMEYESESLI